MGVAISAIRQDVVELNARNCSVLVGDALVQLALDAPYDLGRIETIVGALMVIRTGLMHLSPFSGLKGKVGGLILHDNVDLLSVDGLERLTALGVSGDVNSIGENAGTGYA